MAPIPKIIKPSGAYYRKIAKEKKEKLDKTIKNSNWVDKMFHQLNNSVKITQMVQPITIVHHLICRCIMKMRSKNSEILLNEENKIIQKCGNNSDDVKSLDADFSHDFKIPGTDPADWNISEFTIDYVCKNGYSQNLDSNFSRSKRLYRTASMKPPEPNHTVDWTTFQSFMNSVNHSPSSGSSTSSIDLAIKNLTTHMSNGIVSITFLIAHSKRSRVLPKKLQLEIDLK
ncbi:hypothetical protein ACI65C_009710 [Semiaphis heraclei]